MRNCSTKAGCESVSLLILYAAHLLVFFLLLAAIADLWRYVAMWEYGGIYTDMDNLPGPLFNATTITPDIDAFFLQEQGGYVSQFFFAVAPRHPLMFLAVHDVMEREYTVGQTIGIGLVVPHSDVDVCSPSPCPCICTATKYMLNITEMHLAEDWGKMVSNSHGEFPGLCHCSLNEATSH